MRTRIRRIAATCSSVSTSGYAKSRAFDTNRRPSASSPATNRARSSDWNSHVSAHRSQYSRNEASDRASGPLRPSGPEVGVDRPPASRTRRHHALGGAAGLAEVVGPLPLVHEHHVEVGGERQLLGAELARARSPRAGPRWPPRRRPRATTPSATPASSPPELGDARPPAPRTRRRRGPARRRGRPGTAVLGGGSSYSDLTSVGPGDQRVGERGAGARQRGQPAGRVRVARPARRPRRSSSRSCSATRSNRTSAASGVGRGQRRRRSPGTASSSTLPEPRGRVDHPRQQRRTRRPGRRTPAPASSSSVDSRSDAGPERRRTPANASSSGR